MPTMSTEQAVAYYKTPYLALLAWKDGQAAYCRGCDAKVPMRKAPPSMLECEAGHKTHAATVMVSGERSE